VGSGLSWASLPAGILSLFDPQLGAGTQAVIRAASGFLSVGMLLLAAPHFRRFFLSERWGGYIASSPGADRVHNPVVAPALFALWLLAGALLALDVWSAAAAAVSLVCARHCFVAMRWRALHRGMGAPGFLAYWLAAAVCLLEVARWHAPEIRPLVLLVLRTDFAAIILSAGLYKLAAGYARQQGMELGLVNPEWGYWWRAYANLPPGHWGFRLLNHLAWATEIAAALLMLLPPTRLLGGLLLILSFAFVATQIRLGVLCEMVMVCGLLYVPAGSLVDGWLAAAAPAALPPSPAGAGLIGPLLTAGLWGYLALLPLAHGGLWLNLLGRRRLPGPLQGALEAYTNAFGILIWRVFSVDIVNFFIRIYQEPRRGGARRLLTEYGWAGGLRYGHVAESVTLTCLFTTLKYYPGDWALFRERLLRYARTVACPADAVLVFEYVSILKEPTRFAFLPVAEYTADLRTAEVAERILSGQVSVRAGHPASPVHAGARPGSYAPKRPDAFGLDKRARRE
jgi:hypothetical protein